VSSLAARGALQEAGRLDPRSVRAWSQRGGLETRAARVDAIISVPSARRLLLLSAPHPSLVERDPSPYTEAALTPIDTSVPRARATTEIAS
jgi:hypothetical protein